MSFDPTIIEAKLALRHIAPEQIVDLACEAIEAGHHGPSVLRVAALVQPSGWEVDQLLPAFMRDAHLTHRALTQTTQTTEMMRTTETTKTAIQRGKLLPSPSMGAAARDVMPASSKPSVTSGLKGKRLEGKIAVFASTKRLLKLTATHPLSVLWPPRPHLTL